MKGHFQIAIVSTVAIFLCSCMASTVHLGQRPSIDKSYGATRGDFDLLWTAGVKGQPILHALPPDQAAGDTKPPKNGLFTRLALSLGSLIDLPFSLVTDTVLLPFDLFFPTKAAE